MFRTWWPRSSASIAAGGALDQGAPRRCRRLNGEFGSDRGAMCGSPCRDNTTAGNSTALGPHSLTAWHEKRRCRRERRVSGHRPYIDVNEGWRRSGGVTGALPRRVPVAPSPRGQAPHLRPGHLPVGPGGHRCRMERRIAGQCHKNRVSCLKRPVQLRRRLSDYSRAFSSQYRRAACSHTQAAHQQRWDVSALRLRQSSAQ